mmetsp:Transcript_21693/g.30414  ORF Transcript_21693/g.30414 Transcript_21693/m.30414 type:complete len:186 (-) Transcript_21693:594-1151(-)
MGERGKIILTGFGAFGNVTSNPTEKLILSLQEELQEDELYQFYVLPVSFSHCSNWSEEHILDTTCLIIHFGVSESSRIIQLETTGRNIIGKRKDVNGHSQGGQIIENGPGQIETKLDLCLVNRDPDCEISHNAGDYLCNFIFYKSLLVAPEKTLFVHVPPEEVVSIDELKNFTLKMIRNLQSQVD